MRTRSENTFRPSLFSITYLLYAVFHIGIVALTLIEAQASVNRVSLIVSVDWEGEDLNPSNLNAIKRFRDTFPDLKLLHFLSAAYFTKPSVNKARVRAQISSVLRPGDEIGLHVHAWKSLVESSGVVFKNKPTYWGNSLENCTYDCGHEVALNTYSTSSIQKIIQFSVQTLVSEGFGRPTTFRTGGWLGTPSVLNAIAAEGFTIDSSAVPPIHLQTGLGSNPLMNWISNLWSQTQSTDQPYLAKTNQGTLWEVPDNGALADYMSPSQMMNVFQQNVDLQKRLGRNMYVQIGFHQETAKVYLPRVTKVIQQMMNLAQKDSIPLEFAHLPLINGLH